MDDATGLKRCPWPTSDPLYRDYHDREWGVPVHDDQRLFEFLTLEGAQADPGIVRNRLKVESTVGNARAFLRVREEFGSFAAYMWRFVDGRPRQNAWRTLAEIPASTPESAAFSRDLKQRGFRFVGTTICYAHMQAVGMVNDHLVNCFRWRELGGGGH